MKRPVSPVLLLVLMLAGPAAGQESFRVELGRDGETLADMHPVFLTFENRPLPAISPEEVARRYRRLFETSGEPEVRVDALNRLAQIRDRSGLELGLSAEQEVGLYRDALASYEAILSRGAFSGRLDELLYQMAKAYALTGQPGRSVERLEQLVGLYPDSPLVPEAQFRIAEAAFAGGQYPKAESHYQALLAGSGRPDLKAKARYMMGWSQFKQGEAAWRRATITFMAVLDQFLPDAPSLARVPEASIDTLDDTLRVLAMMAARTGGVAALDTWLARAPTLPAWAALLYDRLADVYTQQGRFEEAVAVNQAFVNRYPQHPTVPDFRDQIISVWQAAGQPDRAEGARADYVAAYREGAAYRRLDARHQERWRRFARAWADSRYVNASALRRAGDLAGAAEWYAPAAAEYQRLAMRVVAPGPLWRLAGDAWLGAGRQAPALAAFRTAGYQVPGYDAAVDSAWAEVRVLIDRVGRLAAADQSLALVSLSAAVDRFTETYPDDPRGTGALADVAGRWLTLGNGNRAQVYARRVQVHPLAQPSERYAAWLVTARVRQAAGAFASAERAWRQALALHHGAGTEAAREEAKLRRQLAESIYHQGAQAADQGDVPLAVAHFLRIETVLPGSEVAIQGRFDAANTLLRASQWQDAIHQLQRFRHDYPDHPLAVRIRDKLVLAYSRSGQPRRAADELLARARDLANPWPDRLRAAELYHDAGDIEARNALYRQYLATSPVPTEGPDHRRLQRLRHRLLSTEAIPEPWHEALVRAELDSPWHSDQTLAWATDSAWVLARQAADRFRSLPLVQPLEDALARKERALAAVRQRLEQAERLGGEAVRSQVLFLRAELYRQLARDLMASEVPGSLNELEALQYRVLLEEEAYPFEEEAIALHEANHQRITKTGYDEWIGKSLEALARMHPGRYQRQVRWMEWHPEVTNDGA